MRYQSLDLWRGLACLMVVVCHSGYYEASRSTSPLIHLIMTVGAMGVPLFFVISGYCITASALSCAKKGHGARVYFMRRFRRIFPPYWTAIALAAVFVSSIELLQPGVFTDIYEDGHAHPMQCPWWLSPTQWLGNLTLTEGWRYHLIAESDHHFFLGQAWTLGYEEQFYAVMGLGLLVARRHIMAFAAVVSAVVLVILARAHIPILSHIQPKMLEGFFFDGLWLQFAAGIVVYYAINVGGKFPAVLLLLAAAYRFASLGDTYPWSFAFAAALIMLWPFDTRIIGGRLLAPLTKCGLMTYSIYLVHRPICKLISHECWLSGVHGTSATLLITVPACLVASVVAGGLFFTTIERRFLNTTQGAKQHRIRQLMRGGS